MVPRVLKMNLLNDKQYKSKLRTKTCNETVNEQQMIECNPIMAYSLVRFVLIFFNDIQTREFSFILGTKAIRKTLKNEYREKTVKHLTVL